MSNVVEDIRDFCTIKKTDFDGIFDDFFLKRSLKIGDLLKLDDAEYYQNCDIFKIEIKA